MKGLWKKKVQAPKKESEVMGEKRKGRRFCPETAALQEIQKYQKSMGFLIRKLPFARWVRDHPGSEG